MAEARSGQEMDQVRLLVIANSFPDEKDVHPGGVFIKEQVKALAPLLEEVHVVFPSTLGLSYRPREDFRDYSFGNVHVHFLPYFNVPLFLRVFRRGFTWFMARAVTRLVAREGIGFDVIHAHFTWPSGSAAVRLKAVHKAPVVVTEHTSIAFEKALAGRDPVFMDAWRRADAVVRLKEGDIDRMAAAGVPREKLHFIPNGFDDAKFRPMDRAECRSRLGLPSDSTILLSVGSLHDFKGHRYLVEAMAKVVRERADAKCYMLGDGPLRQALKAQVAAAGLEQQVELVGSAPYNDIPVWMGACDLVVHPSLSESGPMVMYEALGCGRPFVGTRVGSVPDVVTSDEVGIVCAPGDSAALSGSIVSALSRTWNPERISSHVAGYSSGQTAKKLMALYENVLR